MIFNIKIFFRSLILILTTINPLFSKGYEIIDTKFTVHSSSADTTKLKSVLKNTGQFFRELLKRHKIPPNYIPVNSVDFVDRNEFYNSIDVEMKTL